MKTLNIKPVSQKVSPERARTLFEQMREAANNPPLQEETPTKCPSIIRASPEIVIAKMMAQSRH